MAQDGCGFCDRIPLVFGPLVWLRFVLLTLPSKRSVRVRLVLPVFKLVVEVILEFPEPVLVETLDDVLEPDLEVVFVVRCPPDVRVVFFV